MPEIGEILRDARMRAGIDVSEVEQATKIRAKYIRALENEEWGLLPGPTFVKTFLRTYAEFLGLDARLLVEEYKQQFEGYSDFDLVGIAPPVRGRERRPPRRRGPSRALLLAVIIVGIVGLLVVLGVTGGGSGGSGSGTTATRAETTPAVTRPTTTAVTPPPVPTTVKLDFKPTEDVYVCLRNAGGKLVLNDTLKAGETGRAYTSKEFKLTVGNSAVTLIVNGRSVKVPASDQPTNYDLRPTRTRITDQNAC